LRRKDLPAAQSSCECRSEGIADCSVHQVNQERRKQNRERGPRPIETDDEREQQHNDYEAHRDLSSTLFVLSSDQEVGEGVKMTHCIVAAFPRGLFGEGLLFVQSFGRGGSNAWQNHT
jgi:hypothetical protein